METGMQEGLNRLAKEKLVTIISDLQNMPAEVAMKVSEHIPGLFGVCSDALARIDSAYKYTIDGLERDIQRQINVLNSTKSLYEKDYNEAKTSEEKERYSLWIADIDKQVREVQKEGAEARIKCFNTHAKYVFAIGSLAAAGIGVTIKMGKKLR